MARWLRASVPDSFRRGRGFIHRLRTKHCSSFSASLFMIFSFHFTNLYKIFQDSHFSCNDTPQLDNICANDNSVCFQYSDMPCCSSCGFYQQKKTCHAIGVVVMLLWETISIKAHFCITSFVIFNVLGAHTRAFV